MLTHLLDAPRVGRLLAANIAYEEGPHGALFLLAETVFAVAGANTVFELDRHLTTQLLATDFCRDDPIPARFCRLPVDVPMFVHLPSPPDALHVACSSDALPLSGYYLREVQTDSRRILEVIAVSRPPEGDHTCDADNFLFVDIVIEDEDEPLLALFERADQRARAAAGQPDRPDLRSPVLPHLSFVAKLLVYLGMREVRQSLHQDRTNALAVANRLGPRKKDSAIRRAERIYDYVRITAPPPSRPDTQPSASGTPPSVHHRRGHFRLAHVGDGRIDRRLVWIRPTLVRGMSAELRAFRVS